MRYSDKREKYHGDGEEVSNQTDLEGRAGRHVKCWSLSYRDTYVNVVYIIVIISFSSGI